MKIKGQTDIKFRSMLSTSEQSSDVALHKPLKGMSHYGDYLETMKKPGQASPLLGRSVKKGFQKQTYLSPGASLKQAAKFFSGAHAPALKKSKKH